MSTVDRPAPTFDIRSFEQRLEAKNQFDGNLVHGAGKFHAVTNRSGVNRPSSGYLIPEHAKVVVDTGRERYVRKDGFWEDVNECPACKSPQREFFLSRMGLDIYRCKNCTHRYMHPRVTFAAVGEIYRDDRTASDIYTQPLQIQIDEIKYQYGLDLIEQLDPPARDKIMDIGCGAGVFLKMADRNAWKHCIGIDINENYSTIYKATAGVQFINSSFERMDPEKIGHNYDVISMWSVLEHLYDLHYILDRIKEMLKPGGMLFILVPNAASLASRLMREHSPTFNWKHVSHFTPQSLKMLMELHGLKCEHFETVITEIDNIKSYMSGEYPYHGFGDPEHLFDWITPDYLHRNLLGSRQIGVFPQAMIRGKPLTAIIPVRGGSKGIPGKNLHHVGKSTLLERGIKLAQRCSYIDKVVVSTDHPEMYAISQQYGVAMPEPRPEELATDHAKTVDVVLQAMETVPFPEGYVLLLQATSPLRTLEDLNGFCKTFDNDKTGARAIVTLVRHDSPHPDKIQKIEHGFVASYTGKESMVARQSLPEVYSPNGAFYLTDTDQLREGRSFIPKGATLPYVMPHERSINLDNMFDVLVMDALLEKGILHAEEYD